MKARDLKAAVRRRNPLADLIDAVRRMAGEIKPSFDWRNNEFNPQDPRIVTVLLGFLAAWLSIALLAALFAGQP